MPLTFRCQNELPPDLPPIPIPGLDGIMSNDGVAKVFNLDPRLQDSKPVKHHNMAPREGGFLDSLRASFSSKSIKADSRPTPTRKRRGKEKERERDLSFVILPRSASSLIPGKTSVPLPPMPRRDDRLPRHSNIFTGIPTPTDSGSTSARNSQHAISKPGTPVHGHPLRSSRSVPDWTADKGKQYCYFQDTSEDELPRIPSAYEPQSIPNPGMAAERFEMLEGVTKGSKISEESSLKLTSIGRYKRKQVASRANEDEAFRQQRSSMKSLKQIPSAETVDIETKEALSSFLPRDGPGNGNILQIPVRKQPQQPQGQSPIPSASLHLKQMKARRRTTTDDQKHTSFTSQDLPDRPMSTSAYQAHRGHTLFPVVEEALQPINLPRWNSIWSPHLQQESELFFKIEAGGVTMEQAPVEMGISSPRHRHKARPASWACPTRPTAKGPRIMSRNEYEFDFMLPPTPPSSAGDVWDDHNYTDGERKIFWNSIRNVWNAFVMVWALILVFKSLQFLARFVDVVVLEPGRFLCDVLGGAVER